MFTIRGRQRNTAMAVQQFAQLAIILIAMAQHTSCFSSKQHPSVVATNTTQIRVFSAGEDGYFCFRIPALLFTGPGTLLAFAEGRGRDSKSCDDHGDVHIVVKRSSDFGRTWSNLTIVHMEEGHTIGNPAPVLDEQSSIITLVYCRDNLEVFAIQSNDDGLSWTNPHNITASVRESDWGFTGAGPPGGIQLPSGRLVICMYASIPGSYVIFSDDGGSTWKRSESIGAAGSGECQVAILGQDSPSPLLVMASRSQHGRYISYSNNSGETWFNTSISNSLAPQTPCESSLVAMTYKVVYMDTHLYLTAPHSTVRDNLTLFTSSDGGHSWNHGELVIWTGPAGYSSLAYNQLKLYCLYERGEEGEEYWKSLTLAILSPLI